MPTDWHTREEVLSSVNAASENLDPLINRSYTDSFFTPTTTANLLRDLPSQIVLLLEEKNTMGSHRLIRCAFPDKKKGEKRGRDKVYRG